MVLLGIFLILTFILQHFKCLDVVPERPQIDYVNDKFISYAKINIGKRKRNSPYYIDLDFETKFGAGNNLTVEIVPMHLLKNCTNFKICLMHFLLNEYLSGRYHPMLIQGDYKLCDFLYHEPYLGQMYAKQLPGNWTCPFPPGKYRFHDIVIHLENFPFILPFTWSSVSVKTRADVDGYFVTKEKKELAFTFKVFVTITQKPKTRK